MQKLFENWREYRKAILEEADKYEYCRQNGIPMRACKDIPATHLPTKKSWARTQGLISDNIEEMISVQRQMLSFIFPPLAIPEVVDAFEKLNSNPSLANAGYAALAMLAAIPFIGAPAKGGVALKAASQADKVKTANQIISSAKKTSKAMKGAPQYQKLASEIDDAVEEALKSLSNYMHTNQGLGLVGKEKLNTLLKMARGGKAVGYSGKAYRGARAGDVLHLVDQLNIPGIAKRDGLDYAKVRAGRATQNDISNQADHFFKRELQKVNDKPGEWVSP
jgi:hypothetical protein